MNEETNYTPGMKVVFLSGAGGVGKTSVAKLLVELAQTNHVQVLSTQSTTRLSYAKCGLENEKQCVDLDVEGQLRLQTQIFQDYKENLDNVVDVACANNIKLLIVDRSPLDHVSYMLQLIPSLDIHQVTTAVSAACSTLLRISRKIAEHNYVPYTIGEYSSLRNPQVFIWLFGYPVAWETSGAVNDGFRHAPAARNFVWSSLLRDMTRHLVREKIQGIRVNEIIPMDTSTPQQRAEAIFQRVMTG